MQIRVQRVHVPFAEDDGARVLVDRLRPRGIAKARLADATWRSEIAPSDALRKSFAHRPGAGPISAAALAEPDHDPDAVARLRALAGDGRLTLPYAARDEVHNDAVALRDYLLAR